jgi:hypothetical protein
VFTSVATETPNSVRIRTDEGNEYRFDAIERAADHYDRNQSDTVACACEDYARLLEAVDNVLHREDRTLEQRREIAERFDRVASVEISARLQVDID